MLMQRVQTILALAACGLSRKRAGVKLYFYDGTTNHVIGQVDQSGKAYFGNNYVNTIRSQVFLKETVEQKLCHSMTQALYRFL